MVVNKEELYITPCMALHLSFIKYSSPKTYENEGTPAFIYDMEKEGLIVRTIKVVEAWRLTPVGRKVLEENSYKTDGGYKYTDRDKE